MHFGLILAVDDWTRVEDFSGRNLRIGYLRMEERSIYLPVPYWLSVASLDIECWLNSCRTRGRKEKVFGLLESSFSAFLCLSLQWLFESYKPVVL